MRRFFPRLVGAGLLVIVAGSACSSATRAPAGRVIQPGASGPPVAAPFRLVTTQPDLNFINGMIAHHAQAVLMAGWAPTHGASTSVRILCERIVVGQRDEIMLMKRWLTDRGLPVPAGDAAHDMMPGMDHKLHPGMLSAEQLIELDKARGTEFDRLFLNFMILHHLGAVAMVDELNASAGAAQDELVFRLSSDIYADQTTEIDRMQKMLAALPSGARSPE